MKKVGFTSEMERILSGMIGKKLIKIVYEDEQFFRSFGNLEIVMEDSLIEIDDEEDACGIFEDDDSSHFSCKVIKEFIPCVHTEYSDLIIDDVVKEINIISDQIDIDEYNYHFDYDMALEIVTNSHKYIIGRNIYFSSLMTIDVDKDFDLIYPIEKVICDWTEDDDNLEVKIKRVTRKVTERSNIA